MREEIKAILKRPVVWVTIFGVSLVPMLYNVIFLSSMWDPYGNVNHLPVAVVNQDKAAKFNGKDLTIGKNMVRNMAENDSLDYHFVSQSEAEKGLNHGDYYMVVTLPEDLSQNATTLMTAHPKKMQINYQTTKGRSFVASKMSDSAMSKLESSVSNSLTQTYTQAVFQSMTKLQGGMSQAADGSSTLATGADMAKSGSQTLGDNLDLLSTSTQTLASGAGSLNSGLQTYAGGVEQLSAGLNLMNANMGSLSNGVSALSSGADSAQPLVTGANQLATGINQLATNTGLSPEQKTQIDQIIAALPALNSTIQTLNQSVSQMGGTTTSQTSTPTTSQTSTAPDLSSLQTSLASLETQLQSLSGTRTSTTTADTSGQLAAVQSTSAYQSLTPEQQAEISGAITNNAPQSSTSSVDVSGLIATVQGLETSLANIGTTNSTTTTSNAMTPAATTPDFSGLQTNLSTLAAQANVLLPGAATSLSSLESGMSTLNTTLSQQVLPGSQEVAGGIGTMQSQLASGSYQLATGVSTLSNATSTLANGANQLSSNSGQLTSGADQLASGANQLSSGASQLAQGSASLTSGLSTLSTGADTLSKSLAKAKGQLDVVSVKPSNAKAVAQPLNVKHTDKDNVETNGVGMAPYMMSVALMVVALSANVIFAKALSGKEPRNRFAWAKNKLLINGLIATASATILFFAVQAIGVHPNYTGKTYLVTLFAAWALMALVTALVGWDQRYGSFASLIILLLQLGSSAGTYPIELSPKFFKIVQPYLPMSYSVLGLRKTISLTGDVGRELTTLLAFMVGAMILGLLIYRQQDDR